MKFFFDNNLPPDWGKCFQVCSVAHFPKSVVEEVVHLQDRFDGSTQDLDWIKALGEEKNWVIISGDSFRKNRGAERKALRDSGLSVFVLQPSWSSYPYWAKTAQLMHWWPKIVDHANNVDKFCMEVPWRTSGKFKQI